MADKESTKKERIQLLNERRKTIYDRLTGKHELDRNTSLAILANLEFESGHTLDPSTKQFKDKTEEQWWKAVDSKKYGRGTGIAQWDGSRRFDLKAYAEENERELYDIDTQVDFLMHEMATTEKGAMEAMKASDTLEGKTEAFLTKFERAGIGHLKHRLGKLKAYEGLGIDTEVQDRKAQGDQVLNQPLPEDFQEKVIDDVMSLEVIKGSRVPNSVGEASQLIKHVQGQKDLSNSNPLEVINEVNNYVKEQESNFLSTEGSQLKNELDMDMTKPNFSSSNRTPSVTADFGGSSSFQQSGIVERGLRTVPQGFDYAYENVKRIPDIEQDDIDQLGNHFVNQLTEEGALGNLIQRGIQGSITSDQLDPNFDPKQDMLYEELTKDLSSEELTSLLEDYSYNQKDFRTVATLMQQRNKRIQSMSEYAKENPVLNAAGFMGALMTDAVVMMPVTSAIAAQGAATLTGSSLKSLSAAKKLGWLTAAETLEQGGQELVWDAYKKDYEFSLPIFMAGIGMGVGVRSVVDNVQNNKMIRELVSNEEGFINLGKKEAKELVRVVAKEADSEQAVQLASRLSELKLAKAQEIRKGLLQDYDLVQVGIQEAKQTLRQSVKGSSEAKFAKSEVQRLLRKAKTMEKHTGQELRQVLLGTHPKLTTALNPEFGLKRMTKELGIDHKLVDTPDKLREFLGIRSGKFAESIIVDGEKGYELVLNKQLKELSDNKRINANHFLTEVSNTMKTSPTDINAGISRHLQGLGNKASDFIVNQANTDSSMTKYLFNKGNLVNSENAHVSGFYNWLAPDNSGRQGMSHIRAGETKTIYRNRYHGSMMDNYKTQGYELLKHMNSDKSLANKLSVYTDFAKFENDVVPIFRDRLVMDKADFMKKYPDTKVQEISDTFAKGYNQLNKEVADDAISKGVLGVGANSENYIHRSWASDKARLIPKEDLREAIYQGMHKSILDAGLPFDETFLRTEAKNFAFGLQSKDITNHIEANSTYIENLNKFLKSAEGSSDSGVKGAVESAIQKANAQKTANELGELGKRAEIDINAEIPNSGGKTLADLMDDNFIATQDRYNSRMAARTAAAEHGIKDIKVLDSWRADAILAEKKRLIETNDPHIAANVEYLDKVLKQDIKSFQYGGLGGQGDVLEADMNDVMRLMKKITVTNLMQNVGIASMAEFGGTVSEIGMFNALKSTIDPIQQMIRKNHILGSGVTNIRTLTDDMSALTGIGMGDMAFSSRGVSQAEQIYKNGVMSSVEKSIDAMGSVTQNTLGWVETVGRKATSNGLAIKWGQHFKGNEPKGIISKFMSFDKVTTNRTLENSGLGTWIEEGGKQVFKTNDTYDAIKNNYLKHVSFDENGSVKAMNFDKWDADARDSFRNTIKLQTSHIYADPDSTTAAHWQTTSLGRILNQFRTFSVNSTSKIAGFTYGNLVNGIKHQDADEVLKFSNKMFWAATMGTLAVGVRDELTSAGTGNDKGFSELASTPLQSIAIGFSRSSLIANMDTVNGIGGALFGYDNIFNRSSFTGRNKNFFNLAETPIGQLGTNAFKGASSLIQGDLEGAGKAAGKLTPFKRQLGIQQMINILNK